MSQSFKFNQLNKQVLEKLSCRNISEQEAFEAEKDLLGAFDWLWEMDKKYNPELYGKEKQC